MAKKIPTVKESLRLCLLKYPSIFPNKWSVYHHWFIVNGNGYFWRKGALTEGTDRFDYTKEDAIKKIHDKFNKSVKEENEWEEFEKSEILLNLFEKRRDEQLDLTNKIDERMLDFTPKREELYPLCSFAKILNIPKNIRDDWKEASDEFFNYLMDNYDTLDEHNKNYLKDIHRENRLSKLMD
jgi:hypothetical protein